MARYFKIIEIDRDSFTEATEKDLDGCCQLIVPSGGEVYVSVDDLECEMCIPIETFEEEDNDDN